MVVPLNGAIGPASADFVSRALARAAATGAIAWALVVVCARAPVAVDLDGHASL